MHLFNLNHSETKIMSLCWPKWCGTPLLSSAQAKEGQNVKFYCRLDGANGMTDSFISEMFFLPIIVVARRTILSHCGLDSTAMEESSTIIDLTIDAAELRSIARNPHTQ